MADPAVLEAVLLNMQAQIQQQHQAHVEQQQQQAAQHALDMQHLQAMLQQALLHGAAGHAAAAHVAPHRGGPRTNEIPKYEGTTPLNVWESTMKQLFTYHGLADDAARIRIAAMALGGAALAWWEMHPNQPATWVDVVAGLRARFQPVTSEETARTKLLALSQKGSVHDYVATFNTLLARVPTMDLATQLHVFTHGLNDRPRDAVRASAAIVTLQDAITLAVKVGAIASRSSAQSAAASSAMDLSALEFDDGNDPVVRDAYLAGMNAREAYGGAARGHGSSGAGSGRGAQGASGGFERTYPSIRNMSEDQVKQYMKEGKCFRCGKTDHQSRNCPKKKTGGSSESK